MTVPSFDLQGGFPLCAARTIFVGALLSAFGSSTFHSVVAPAAFAGMPPDTATATKATLVALTRVSTAIALLGAGLWLLVQAGAMADARSIAQALAALPTMLGRTAFGHVMVAQSAALAILLAVLGRHDRPGRQHAALGVASTALVLQAGHSHAYSMYGGPSVLLACEILHLLGAGAWLGGLVPLLVLVRSAPPRAAAIAARRFSPLGKACIAALIVSAAVQGWVLVATLPGLVGTAYGWMVLAKLVLFGVLLGFAAVNRYRLAPALIQGHPEQARRMLMRSLVLQTGFGLAIIAAAVVLSELPPAMHEQPTWPFAQRFSLAAVQEDADFRREVILAGLALAGALAVLAVCLVMRRFRPAAGALAAVVAWRAVPHFDLLLVPAYPSSFYRSPTGFASASIALGQTIYAAHCVSCHGADGHGDGPAAKALPVPPADLLASHLWMHSDGELFWWLAHGMTTPEGAQAMPGFAAILDDDQRWAAIDFIRARNAGATMRSTGGWTPPLRAPGLDADCGGAPTRLADLRGRFVRLQFGTVPEASGRGDVVTLVAGPAAQKASSGQCVSRDQTVPLAYAIVAGLGLAALPGTAFLIDGEGWLRAMQRAGAASPWTDAAALDAEIRSLRGHPVDDAAAAPMKMPM